MRGLPCSSHLLQTILLSILSYAIGSRAEINRVSERNVYVVYMGAAKSYLESPEDNHLQLLSSVLDRNDQNLEHSYRHAISGFAANLSKKEAERIAEMEGVVSVFEDRSYKLHTTQSWDFLQSLTDLPAHSNSSTSTHMPLDGATDTIIGLIDTGIWPESKSFDDKDMGPIPKRWKGVCMQPNDLSTFSCNRKLIGARYYIDETPRDRDGHGTHTASTAAGNSVPFASYYNLVQGTAKGGSPTSRIAVYKICMFGNTCDGSVILSAFDDAIADGVDVISVSMGGTPGTDFLQDPIAIGAFHAVEKGITVVCSAGNDGPASKTLTNSAPWIITVSATTIDRVFESNVVLGGEVGSTHKNNNLVVVKGEGINFSTLQKSPIYPLIYAGSAKLNSVSPPDNGTRNCKRESLDGSKIKGKIVLCDSDDVLLLMVEREDVIKSLGGIGLISIGVFENNGAYISGDFPVTIVSPQGADDIRTYIDSTRNPVATILRTEVVMNYKPAPTIADFSSRGPFLLTRNVLKPDIAAPGVNILAAWKETNDSHENPANQNPALFRFVSGTSMSCPHVSGVAAAIKSINPIWSPSAIRSAIMTTAEKALSTVAVETCKINDSFTSKKTNGWNCTSSSDFATKHSLSLSD